MIDLHSREPAKTKDELNRLHHNDESARNSSQSSFVHNPCNAYGRRAPASFSIHADNMTLDICGSYETTFLKMTWKGSNGPFPIYLELFHGERVSTHLGR